MKSAPARAALTIWVSALAVAPALAGLDETLGTADPDRGESLFGKCAACHTVDPGGKNRAGPNLYGIVGKSVAATDGFQYSPALKEYGGEWSVERLDAFLARPRAEVRGTKMGFAGLNKPEDRIDLIAFLDRNSDAPVAGGQDQASASPEAAYEEPEFGLFLEADGVETTYYACAACHSEMIVAQQGLTRDGWSELIDWMVEDQGMTRPEEPELTEILDYLSTYYNTDRPNFPDHQDRARRQVVAD